jgi:hypothetical protein
VIELSELKLLKLSSVALEKHLPPKSTKIESRLDALQATFSDKNRMR